MAKTLDYCSCPVKGCSVGHVLKKVDSSQSEEMRRAIEEKWRSVSNSKPNPAILWKFIEIERNNILKEYRINAGQSITVVIGGPTSYLYEINSGPFKGRNQREIAQEAIEFWESYLDDVDSIAKR